eukprot:g14104.t1
MVDLLRTPKGEFHRKEWRERFAAAALRHVRLTVVVTFLLLLLLAMYSSFFRIFMAFACITAFLLVIDRNYNEGRIGLRLYVKLEPYLPKFEGVEFDEDGHKIKEKYIPPEDGDDEKLKHVKPLRGRFPDERWRWHFFNFGRYEPFDEKIKRTDIEFYKPHWLIKYTDLNARRMDRAGDTEATELPATWCGAICSTFLFVFVCIFGFNSMSSLTGDSTSLVAWGDLALNVDQYCSGLSRYRGAGVTKAERLQMMNFSNGEFLAADPDDTLPLPGCEFNELYFPKIPERFSGERPFLDLPVMNFDWTQRIEFYEEDDMSSLAKISWTDKLGLHFGGTSYTQPVPIAFGAMDMAIYSTSPGSTSKKL